MSECGVASALNGAQEKGRKKKRKLADPPADSLTEFPRYELDPLNFQNPLSENEDAMNQIVECGYSDDAVLKAISGSRLYCGGNDLVSNIFNDTLSFLKSGKKVSGLRDYLFEDLQQLVAYTLVEKISLIMEVRRSLSTVEAVWRLLEGDD
ncbi:hypothetical protein F2Q69_00021592 [Brassica cretica]|uniref:PIR2-like helical domain-containing protein n=1 Tax=Brassica cretica TaxID=69181 RepID=A0A8S9QKQ9_BRACR|nr:hypothetical protein F2Q69_00021592 [Brassica cretica]